MTTEQIEEIDTVGQLKGYPKSKYFTVGYELHVACRKVLAMDAFKRGAELEGCVPCMLMYVMYCNDRTKKNYHSAVPWALEGAIRGNIGCMNELVHYYYSKTRPTRALAIENFWSKLMLELGSDHTTKEHRKEIKNIIGNKCFVCGKEESEENDVTLVKCGKCKIYSYCGKECQLYHWNAEGGGNHIGECRQLKILQHYCKPRYVREIRDAIIRGDDPKDIDRLQAFRTKIGLNRPKEEYEEELMMCVPVHLPSNDVNKENDNGRSNKSSPNPCIDLVGRKDGTVHIGSTPESI